MAEFQAELSHGGPFRPIFCSLGIGYATRFPTIVTKHAHHKTPYGDRSKGILMNLGDDPEFNHVKTKHSSAMVDRIHSVPEGESLYSK